MLQIHRELEEAAAVAGASPMRRLRRIIAAAAGASLIAGWLFIFLLATRVLTLAVLLAGAALADHGGRHVRSVE